MTYDATWESLDSRPTPAWFNEAKLGIFIHWGIYSVPAWGPERDRVRTPGEAYAEWYGMHMLNPKSEVYDYHRRTYGERLKYTDFVAGFRAENFEPERWADLFAKSGAGYVVLVSKHHDGFCLWPSAQAHNWNSVEVGPHRDLVAEVGEAVRAKGLRMGLYYSLSEWFHPWTSELIAAEERDLPRYVEEHMLPQMKDVVERYRPAVLFPDGHWTATTETWRSREFLAWLFNESSVRDEIAVNDRWGYSPEGENTMGRHGGFFTPEYDEISHEEKIEFEETHPWAECRGVGTSFGYNRNEDTSDYLSEKALIHLLIEKVSRGGGLLLNVGPTADGRIPVIQEERLLQLGEWLAVNGEAIRGTTKWRVVGEGDVRYTQGKDAVYAICLKWPGEELVVEAPEGKVEAEMLGYGPVASRVEGGKVHIQTPRLGPGEAPCRHAYCFRLEARGTLSP